MGKFRYLTTGASGIVGQLTLIGPNPSVAATWRVYGSGKRAARFITAEVFTCPRGSVPHSPKYPAIWSWMRRGEVFIPLDEIIFKHDASYNYEWSQYNLKKV